MYMQIWYIRAKYRWQYKFYNVHLFVDLQSKFRPLSQQWNYWTIQTPVQIKVKPFQSKKLSLNAGGYLGFNYYNSESTSSSIFKIQHDNEKNALDIGMNVGIDYNWFKKGDFTLGNSVSYYRGFAYLSHYSLERSQGLTIGCTAKWGF